MAELQQIASDLNELEERFNKHQHTGPDGIPINQRDIVPFPVCGKMETTTTVALSSTVWAKIPFNVSVISTPNITNDITNSRFKVAYAGNYMIMATTSIDSLTSGDIFEARLRVNGTEVDYATGRVVSNTATLLSYVQVNTMLTLKANDYVELWVFQQAGAFNTGSINFMQIFKLN